MSYTKKYRSGLGGTAGDVVGAVTNVVMDPCLGQVAKLVLDLHYAQAGSPSPPSSTVGGGGGNVVGTPTVPPPAAGIGLCKAVKPLTMAVWVARRPWVVPVGAIGLIAGLVGLGYAIGSSSRSK